MTLPFYLDHNVPKAIAYGLRIRGVDVITAYEDFLIEAANRQQMGSPFYGVIYAHQLRVPIGICIDQLEMIAKAGEIEDVYNRVIFLPL